MPTPAPSLQRQMLRRRPVSGAPVADGASDQLQRSLGVFLLTMFGVGETVGSGIFIVLSQSVPQAGPAVVISFLIAGAAAGLAAICYAELASAVPVSGSAYSYAYATLGEFAAMGVAACLLLEYGVSTAAVAVGWSQYLNKFLDNVFGFVLPHAISAAPWDSRTRRREPAGDCAGGDVRAAVDPGCKRIRQGECRDGGDQDQRAGVVLGDRVHRVQRRQLQGSGAFRRIRHQLGLRHDLLRLYRSRRGIHRGRRGQGPATHHAARDHRRPADRHGNPPARLGCRRRRTAVAGLQGRTSGAGGDLGPHHRQYCRQHHCGCGSGDFDILRDAGDAVRPDPDPVHDGPRRAAAGDVREGESAHDDARAATP